MRRSVDFDQWPAVLFGMALCMLALALLSYAPATGLLLCSEDDKSVIVCLRSWANATGNLLTGLVAVAAAIVAYSQWTAALKQVSTARIPALESRLGYAAELDKVARAVRSALYTFGRGLVQLKNEVDNGVVADYLHKTSGNIVSASEQLEEVRTTLRNFLENRRIDTDILEIGQEILDASYPLSGSNMNSFVWPLRSFERNFKDEFVGESSLAELRAVANSYLSGSIEEINKKLHVIRDQLALLDGRIEGVKKQKQEVLELENIE